MVKYIWFPHVDILKITIFELWCLTIKCAIPVYFNFENVIFQFLKFSCIWNTVAIFIVLPKAACRWIKRGNHPVSILKYRHEFGLYCKPLTHPLYHLWTFAISGKCQIFRMMPLYFYWYFTSPRRNFATLLRFYDHGKILVVLKK